MAQQEENREQPSRQVSEKGVIKRFWTYFLGKNFAKKYKLMFTDEKQQKVVFSFRMSFLTATLFFTFLSILTAIFVVLVMTQTPLQSYLPGYLDVEKRKDVVNTSLRLDSLIEQNATRTIYLQNLSKVITGTMGADSLMPIDTIAAQYDRKALLEAASPSSREQAFVAQFGDREKYGLSVLSNADSGAARTFLLPVNGEAQPTDDTMEQRWNLLKPVAVMAPLAGTVVSVDLTLNHSYKIILQHSNGYMTLFSNISMPLVEVGDILQEGNPIGQAGSAKQPETSWVGVSVWHNGRPIDPASVFPL